MSDPDTTHPGVMPSTRTAEPRTPLVTRPLVQHEHDGIAYPATCQKCHAMLEPAEAAAPAACPVCPLTFPHYHRGDDEVVRAAAPAGLDVEALARAMAGAYLSLPKVSRQFGLSGLDAREVAAEYARLLQGKRDDE